MLLLAYPYTHTHTHTPIHIHTAMYPHHHPTHSQASTGNKHVQHVSGEGEGELMAALHRLEKHVRKTKLKLTFAEQLGAMRNAVDEVCVCVACCVCCVCVVVCVVACTCKQHHRLFTPHVVTIYTIMYTCTHPPIHPPTHPHPHVLTMFSGVCQGR